MLLCVFVITLTCQTGKVHTHDGPSSMPFLEEIEHSKRDGITDPAEAEEATITQIVPNVTFVEHWSMSCNSMSV